jgi:hypothetical protein
MQIEPVADDLSGDSRGSKLAGSWCSGIARGVTSMQHRPKTWIVGVAVVSAIALCNLLSAQDQGTPQRKAEDGGRAAGPAGQDTRLLIAHGLAMAIEGSTLQGLALQGGGSMGSAGTSGPGGATGAGATGLSGTGRTGSTGSGAAILGGGAGGTGTPRVGEAGTGTGGSPAGSAGSGLATFGRDPDTAGTPGAGTSGAAAGAPGTGRTAATGAATSDTAAPGRGMAGPAGGGRSMMLGGQSSDQLQQHARRAFEASESLLRQAQNGGGETERFYRAANRYAATLRTLGGASSGRGGAGGGVSAATAANTGGDSMNGIDLTSMTLINHGVKEALDSLQLKQMVRMMGGETAAGRALMDHARQMDAEGQQAIDALAMGGSSQRTDAIGPGRQGTNLSDAGAPGPGTTAAGRTSSPASGGAAITPGGAAATVGETSSAGGRLAGAGGAAATVGEAAGTGGRAAGAGGVSGAGGIRGAELQLLVQQSREVLQAIRELDGQ